MSKQKNIPIRMCIVCKGRFEQNKLHRFRINNFNIEEGCKGRSFYLCDLCIRKNNKDFKKAISKFVKISNLEKLKESVLDGRCSSK